MSIIARMLKQTAVWWPLASSDSAGEDFDDYGLPIVTDPLEIKVRWEDVLEEFIDKNGTMQISKAKVFVDRDIEVGGILMLGLLIDITDSNNPKENDNAFEIKRFDKLPNLKATEFLRTAFL